MQGALERDQKVTMKLPYLDLLGSRAHDPGGGAPPSRGPHSPAGARRRKTRRHRSGVPARAAGDAAPPPASELVPGPAPPGPASASPQQTTPRPGIRGAPARLRPPWRSPPPPASGLQGLGPPLNYPHFPPPGLSAASAKPRPSLALPLIIPTPPQPSLLLG